MPFRTVSYYKFRCDDCYWFEEEIIDVKDARAKGWAISKDYRKCYCPSCAVLRRNVGCKGGRRLRPFSSSKK